MPLIIFLILLIIYNYRKRVLVLKNRSTQVLLVAIVGVLFALFRGGLINGHYLIQLHPLLTIPVAIILGYTLRSVSWDYRPYVLLVMLLVPAEAYKEYYDVARHKVEYGTFQNGEGFAVPAYIIDNQIPTDNILFLEYHIGYWFLDILPLTKAATHPTNLVRDETFKFFDNPRLSSMEEIRYIMEELKPEYVITRKRWHIFDKKRDVEQNTYVREYLESEYKIRQLIDNAEIHQRSK